MRNPPPPAPINLPPSAPLRIAVSYHSSIWLFDISTERCFFRCQCSSMSSAKRGSSPCRSAAWLRRPRRAWAVVPGSGGFPPRAGAQSGRESDRRWSRRSNPPCSNSRKRSPTRGAALAFSSRRWPDGLVCPKCGQGRAALLTSRAWTYECLDCGRQTSVTAGTVMHRSKPSLTAWFWAAHLMATHSNGMSALQLKGQLGLSYRATWLLTQKLRRSMVDPEREPLEGVVEIDQTEIPFRDTQTYFDPNKSGKIIVVGAVEVRD